MCIRDRDTVLTGVKTLVFRSREGKAELVSEPPFPVPETITGFPVSFIRSIVLTADELQELVEAVRRINKGEEAPPSWREVYEDILRMIPEYVGAREEVYVLAALYIIYCYFYDLVDHSVYLLVSGESGSGKRNLSRFIGALTRSISVSGASKAALQRIINVFYPGIIIDETEVDQDFALFLNRGYQRGLYVVLVQDAQANQFLVIDAFSPKVVVSLPERLANIPHDTRNRAVEIVLERRKGYFKRDVDRKEAWPVVKKLYLLMLYRWREFLDTYRLLDPVLSKYFGGHDRDKWLLLATVAHLIGEDVLKKLLEAAVSQYRESRKISEKIFKIIEGVLRATSLYLKYREVAGGGGLSEKEYPPLAELCREVRLDGAGAVGVTPKAVVIANNIEVEGGDGGVPESCRLPLRDYEVKSEAKSIGHTLARAKLPFVASRRREGKEGKRFYYIDLRALEEYVKAYDIELPPDIDYRAIEAATGVNFMHYVQLTPEQIIEEIKSKGLPGRENVSHVRNVSHVSEAKIEENKQLDTKEEENYIEKINRYNSVSAPSADVADNSDKADISESERALQTVYSYREMVEKLLEAEDMPKPYREALKELRRELEAEEELNRKIKEKLGVSEEEVLEFLREPRTPREIEERFGRGVWRLITLLRREDKVVLEKDGQTYRYRTSLKPKTLEEASSEESLVDYVEGLLREVGESEAAG